MRLPPLEAAVRSIGARAEQAFLTEPKAQGRAALCPPAQATPTPPKLRSARPGIHALHRTGAQGIEHRRHVMIPRRTALDWRRLRLAPAPLPITASGT